MTFCKTIAEHQTGRETVTAYESYEKFCSVPRYSVVVSRDGIAMSETKVARTTWKRRFREAVAERR